MSGEYNIDPGGVSQISGRLNEAGAKEASDKLKGVATGSPCGQDIPGCIQFATARNEAVQRLTQFADQAHEGILGYRSLARTSAEAYQENDVVNRDTILQAIDAMPKNG